MLSWLRNRLRAWLGDPTPAAAPIEKKREPIDWVKLLAALGVPDAPVARKWPIVAPTLPPGVIPTKERIAADAAASNNTAGAYMALDSQDMASVFAYANTAYAGLGFPGYSYLSELQLRSEYRAPCETIADECVREWIELITDAKPDEDDGEDDEDELGDGANDLALAKPPESEGDTDTVDGGDEDKIKQLTKALDRFNVKAHFRKLVELDGAMGRAQLFIDMDPGSDDEDVVAQLPLVIAKGSVQKGSLRGFKVIEPIWTTPYSYNSSDPRKPDFYRPVAWYVLGRKTHASRLLTFIGREVPDILKPAFNFGGISLAQLMQPYVDRWLKTVDGINRLINNFSMVTLSTDMGDMLTGGMGAQMDARARLFGKIRSNFALTILNKDTEELGAVNIPLSGLSDLQAQAQEHMAAPSHIPLVKMTGATPAGLNASSEGEIQVWYDFVMSWNGKLLGNHLKTVIDLIQLNEFGEIDDALSHRFIPLSAPTVKELAEIRKADADSGVALITANVISPEEERERLMSDPNSGYDNLTGDPPERPDPTGGLDENGDPVVPAPGGPPGKGGGFFGGK